jgi:hypothetical protein
MLEEYKGLHLRATGDRSYTLGLIETTITGHDGELSVSIYRNYNHIEACSYCCSFLAFILTSKSPPHIHSISRIASHQRVIAIQVLSISFAMLKVMWIIRSPVGSSELKRLLL